MRSSGSTPSLPRRPGPRLFLVVAGEDHPKACTGRRLLKLGRAREVPYPGVLHPAPVLLDPRAPDPLSLADREAALRGGLLAVDCSWNLLADRGAFPSWRGAANSAAVRRRLPVLIAANPQHYGRIAELNTVEALSAGLLLLGFRAEASDLLEGFRGGPGFLEINRERLERYARANSPEEVRDAERELFE
jgi:pre-rRNA-processing protein TSR3